MSEISSTNGRTLVTKRSSERYDYHFHTIAEIAGFYICSQPKGDDCPPHTHTFNGTKVSFECGHTHKIERELNDD